MKSIDTVKGIIIVNVILFLPLLIPGIEEKMLGWLALFFPKNEHFRIWQFVTHMFMHGGFGHILFNMYALWAFGTPLEKIWGQNKFLLFYFICGLGAGIIYTLVNYFQFHNIYNEMVGQNIPVAEIEDLFKNGNISAALNDAFSKDRLEDFYYLVNRPAVGASGAIYGVLVAFGILFPNAKLALLFFPVPIAAKYFIPGLLLLDLFSGITGFSIFGGGIAHFAHIGGAIIGFLMMWYWKKRGYKRQTYQ